LLTFSVLPFLPGLFALAVIALRDRRLGPLGSEPWLREAATLTGCFVLAPALLYLGLQLLLQGRFDYALMIQHANGIFSDTIRTRPWFIWFWLSPVQYFIHVGAAVTTLFFIRWGEILRGDWRNDALPWAGLITMALVFLNATVHNEADRLYIVYTPFVVWTAALALWREATPLRYLSSADGQGKIPETGGGFSAAFGLITALSYINAVVIQLLVVDYW